MKHLGQRYAQYMNRSYSLLAMNVSAQIDINRAKPRSYAAQGGEAV
jgi:hypothetical protein